MFFSDKMNGVLNEQIGHEFAASLQYVAIAVHFDSQGLRELAKHFYRQADEEREHGMRILRYVLDAGGKVAIPAIPAPKGKFQSAEECLNLSVDWENTVTKQIHAIVDLAIKENDHTTRNAMQWFVEEQLEEVSSMEALLGIVRLAGEAGLLQVEDYLARKSAK